MAYFAELAKHVMDEAAARGRTVLLIRPRRCANEKWPRLHGFDAQFSDGVILSPLALNPRDLATRDRRLPVVLLGERPAGAARTTWASTMCVPHARPRNICCPGPAPYRCRRRCRPRPPGHRRAHGRYRGPRGRRVPFDADLVIPVGAYHWRRRRAPLAWNAALARRAVVPERPPCARRAGTHEHGRSVPVTSTSWASTTSRHRASAAQPDHGRPTSGRSRGRGVPAAGADRRPHGAAARHVAGTGSSSGRARAADRQVVVYAVFVAGSVESGRGEDVPTQ